MSTTTAQPGFWTLVGPDMAGKSTVLAGLHRDHGWRVVSYDDEYLTDFPLIRALRERWVTDAFVWSGRRYSAELVLAVLHPIVLHLRDQLRQATGPAPVIVDSYYYKLLAKCTLLGVTHQPTFDSWRSFPRPHGVLYLDVPPQAAWSRSGNGRALNPFEHYGSRPDRAGFTRLQADLRAVLLAEIGDVPVRWLDGLAAPSAVAAEIRQIVQPLVRR